MKFKCGNREIIGGGETMLCGIVNVTPDSFSDGGKYFSTERALMRAKELVRDGAGMLDVGGESTRPGSTPVSAEEEAARVVPVIQAIKREMDVLVSVDTWKSEVAKAAIEAGADIINDITGFAGDLKMAKTVGETNAGVILMFNPVVARPNHESSKVFPSFGKNELFSAEEGAEMEKLPIAEMMKAYLGKSLRLAEQCGIERERVMLDLGIGFGLTKRENLKLLQCVDEIHRMGYFSFVGVSRKRFIVNILQESGIPVDMKTPEGLEEADMGSAFLTAVASYMGVDVLRVHEMSKHFRAKRIADSIRLADETEDIHFKAYERVR